MNPGPFRKKNESSIAIRHKLKQLTEGAPPEAPEEEKEAERDPDMESTPGGRIF